VAIAEGGNEILTSAEFDFSLLGFGGKGEWEGELNNTIRKFNWKDFGAKPVTTLQGGDENYTYYDRVLFTKQNRNNGTLSIGTEWSASRFIGFQGSAYLNIPLQVIRQVQK